MTDKKLDLILKEIQQFREETGKRFDQNESMISALIKTVGDTNARVKNVETDVTILKDNQQTIMQLQQDQQRTQELLAVRSINQEADIKDIRRIK